MDFTQSRVDSFEILIGALGVNMATMYWDVNRTTLHQLEPESPR